MKIFDFDWLILLPLLALWMLTSTAEAGGISMAAYIVGGALSLAAMAGIAYITGTMTDTEPCRRRQRYEQQKRRKRR